MNVSGPYCKAVGLIGYDDIVTKLGGNPHAFLEQAGIPLDALRNPEMLIGFRNFCKLLEITAAQLERRDFAIAWALASQPNFPHMGAIALLANFVSTLQEWLLTGLRYWALHTNGFTLQITLSDGQNLASARYIGDSFVLPSRVSVELAFACLLLLARCGANAPDENPTLMRFQHAAPADTAPFENLFRCPIQWGQEHNEMFFEERQLQLPTRGHLKLIKPLMAYVIRKRIDKITDYDQSATTTVQLAIPSLIGTGHCKAEVIAQSLGTNLKSLQRQLAEEGTNFSELLDNARKHLAENYLRESSVSVERIAHLLDYSSTAPFTSAFRRWTGTSPLKYRQMSQRKA